MKNTRYLIIGGGIAGTNAAETIRNNDVRGKITIISDEPYPLYSRIMLSKPRVLLEKSMPENIFIKKGAWYKKNNIELISGKKATKLSADKKIVTLDDSTTIGYEKLLIATGACARIWNVSGCDKEGIVYVRNFDDAKKIISLLPRVKHAIMIGSGFISFEIADALRKKGITVTEVMLEPYYWYPILDKTAGGIIEKALTGRGVTIIRGQKIKRVMGEKKVEKVLLKDGSVIGCDLVVCGIGVVCTAEWLKTAGCDVNKGVCADEFLKTNLADVWVAGDVAEYRDAIFEKTTQLGNWVHAQMQGKTAGHNMSDVYQKPYTFISSYNSSGFGITISFVGDVKNYKEVITRGPAHDKYSQVFIEGNRVVGAILINSGGDIGALSRLIATKQNISKYKNVLADPQSDLKTLLT